MEAYHSGEHLLQHHFLHRWYCLESLLQHFHPQKDQVQDNHCRLDKEKGSVMVYVMDQMKLHVLVVEECMQVGHS